VFFDYQIKNILRRHYLISAVEHPSVIEAADFLKKLGAEIEVFPILSGGKIDLIDLEKRIRSDTALVSCMLANNETGTIFPVKDISELARKKGALFYVRVVGVDSFFRNRVDMVLARSKYRRHTELRRRI